KTPADARVSKLGYLDSNQEQLNQNQPCCQLHHTPTAPTGVGPRGPAKPDRVATLPYGEGGAEPAGVSRRVACGGAPRPAGGGSGRTVTASDAAAPCARGSRPCRGSPSTRRAAGSPGAPRSRCAAARTQCAA